MSLEIFKKIACVIRPVIGPTRRADWRRRANSGRRKDRSAGFMPIMLPQGGPCSKVEDFVQEYVLPYYANTHTEDSFCGRYTGKMREDARREIARVTGATKANSVIFAGSGATAGLNRLVSLLNVNDAQNPVVFIGPYEHHSNILPWRESKATVVEIPETACGGPDLQALAEALKNHADADLKIGSFSAAVQCDGGHNRYGRSDAIVKEVRRVGRLGLCGRWAIFAN